MLVGLYVCCVLFGACSALFVGRRLLCVICCMLPAVRCLLSGDCYPVSVNRCLSVVVCCLIFVVVCGDWCLV